MNREEFDAAMAELDETSRVYVLLVLEALRRQAAGEALLPVHEEALAWARGLGVAL
jgi:hypothetical protein